MSSTIQQQQHTRESEGSDFVERGRGEGRGKKRKTWTNSKININWKWKKKKKKKEKEVKENKRTNVEWYRKESNDNNNITRQKNI